MTRNTFSKLMRINSGDMPLLRSLNSSWADFYKDVTPTALGNRTPVTTDAIIKKVFNAVPVP